MSGLTYAVSWNYEINKYIWPDEENQRRSAKTIKNFDLVLEGSLFYDAFSVTTLYSVDDRMINE
jgi:hypothetical protein